MTDTGPRVSERSGATSRLNDALDEVEAFLEDQQDVLDGDDGAPRPNRAMSLLLYVQEARASTPSETRHSVLQDVAAAYLVHDAAAGFKNWLERQLKDVTVSVPSATGPSRERLLARACDAAFAFIDSHAADPDLTEEMIRKYATYQEARAELEGTK